MNRKQFALVLVVALIAGLTGGVLSQTFLATAPAVAETNSENGKIITAQEFRLVNEKGEIRGRFLVDEDGSGLFNMISKSGNAMVADFAQPFDNPTIGVQGKSGNVVICSQKLETQSGSAIAFTDAEDRLRAQLGVKNNIPFLTMNQLDGTTPGIGIMVDGSNPRIDMFGLSGKPSWGAP